MSSLTTILQERLAEREALVAQLELDGHLMDPRVEEAMLAIPRHEFIPQSARPEAYHDKPLAVGHGQTISAPHMVAMMSGALMLEPGQRVLEIGGGRGYHAAVLEQLVAPGGKVTTMEVVPELAQAARANLRRIGSNVQVVQQDGADGWAEGAPYDAIIVTCAVPFLPEVLWDQLKDDGRILAPIGTTRCNLTLFRKDGDEWDEEELGPCLFVPAQGRLADTNHFP